MCYYKFSFSVLLLFVVSVVNVQSSFDKLEGDPCESEGVAGKCAHIYKCLSAFLDVKKRKHPTICSFQGRVPIVCCPDCKLVSDAREAIIAKDGTVFYKSAQKAENKCIDLLALLPDTCETGGMSMAWKRDDNQQCKSFIRKGYLGKKRKGFSTVVVGGTDAKRYNFTHMALLGYGEDRKSAQWHCGGSLISEKFILTAGHCLSDPKIGPVRFVVLGILKRSDPEDLWQVYNVKRIVPHPEYRPPSKYHDIALLETDKIVTFNKAVFPACLDVQGKFFIDKDDEIHKFVEDDDYDENDEENDEQQLEEFRKLFTLLEEPVEDQRQAVVTGWGKLGRNRELSDTLQEAYLNRFSERKCLMHFKPNRNLKHGYNATTQMCYGDEKETKDTCEGDSGGPLQVRSQIAQCLHTVIGVTSFGRPCGFSGEAGMYSRVYHYVSWIESVVWPGED